jgi:pimeloyl-ACP methyl ester carboxylesterase
MLLATAMLSGTTGCGATELETPVVIFLDGAGNLTAGGSVRRGLEHAGYDGTFQTFVWTSFLGWGADHFLVTKSSIHAEELAERIARIRERDPGGQISLMGLSAGTAVVLNALEELPPGVQVDKVVLFSSSVSANRNLSPALDHVRGAMYATTSRNDLILSSLVVTADGRNTSAAGRTGFRIPSGLSSRDRDNYRKVVHLNWKPGYVAFGWDGGHVSATNSEFVRAVIAPRIMSDEQFPLDRPLLNVSGGRTPTYRP